MWIILLVIGLVLFITGYISERKWWNRGMCCECNTEWKYFDSDSQGGRGYFCGCPKYHSVWISYPGIDRRRM